MKKLRPPTLQAHITRTHTQPFYGLFSGSTQVSSSGLYGAREDNSGRHTDHPDGCHFIRINQRPTSSSPIFMPDALPVVTLPLYPGLGQAPNMLLGYFQTSAPIAVHNLTVHTAPVFVGGGEMLLGKESPSGSSHSSSAGSGSGPYQVCILSSLS